MAMLLSGGGERLNMLVSALSLQGLCCVEGEWSHGTMLPLTTANPIVLVLCVIIL